MTAPLPGEPDDLHLALQAMGDLLAAVPYRLGYRLEDSQQLAIQLSSPGRQELIALDWLAHQPVPDATQQAAGAIAALTETHQAATILILGYGPDAAARVYALREAVQRDHRDISIAAVQVHESQWRAFGVGVTGEGHHLPEVPVSVLMDGHPARPSLREHLHRYDPLPQPPTSRCPRAHGTSSRLPHQASRPNSPREHCAGSPTVSRSCAPLTVTTTARGSPTGASCCWAHRGPASTAEFA